MMAYGPIQSVDPTKLKDLIGCLGCVMFIVFAYYFVKVWRRK